MPNQCVHCGKMYEDAAKELLEGCSCGSHFFFFVRQKQLEELKQKTIELADVDKKQVEKDVREIIGLEEDREVPVILDLESIRTTGPGKFEIDIVNLFSKKRRDFLKTISFIGYLFRCTATAGRSKNQVKDKDSKREEPKAVYSPKKAYLEVVRIGEGCFSGEKSIGLRDYEWGEGSGFFESKYIKNGRLEVIAVQEKDNLVLVKLPGRTLEAPGDKGYVSVRREQLEYVV